MTPLILHGCVGSGKTSLMAGVACMLGSVTTLKRATTVLRFIRATTSTQCVRHLLLDICKQVRLYIHYVPYIVSVCVLSISCALYTSKSSSNCRIVTDHFVRLCAVC